jgi:catechol 2,3-dioxygenase-like lactoylglutathione lyase family enzyme
MLTETAPERETGTRVLVGKCYCGAIKYRVEDAFVYASNCHCSNCRATTGSAFKPFAGIEREKLEITDGRDSLLIVGDDSLNDSHCAACGSLLFSVVRDGAYVHVALGTLVDAPTLRPTKHIFVGSKAPWFEITDDLPQFDEHAAPVEPAEAAAQSLKKVSAIGLFVRDLQTANTFYRDVFDVDVVFEDETSACVKFNHLFVNLLHASAAREQVDPARSPTARQERGSSSAPGSTTSTPSARSSKSAASPSSPARSTACGACAPPPSPTPTGHSWEIAQELPAAEDS